MAKTSLLFCNCAYYQFISEDKKVAVLDALRDASVSFEAVDDLCGLAAKKDPVLKRWVANDSLTVIACFPRAVQWLFSRGAAPIDSENIQVLNMRTESSEDIIADVKKLDVAEGDCQLDIQKIDDWVPWFPVIDYDRCVNCKQCHNFCLFGVYQTDGDGKVEVANPSSCKTNCPACARVCPQAAIIFPKYDKSPINGDDVKPEHLEKENMQVDLADRLKGNVHELIRNRSGSRSRFSADGSESQSDRLEQLKKLQHQLDIPADVIDNLSENNNDRCPHEDVCDSPCKNKGDVNG